MIETNGDEQKLKVKSKRFGLLSAVLLFFGALLSSLSFSILLILGGAGLYFMFLWIHYSNRSNPRPQTTYSHHSSSRGAVTNSTRPLRILYFTIGGVVLFFVLMSYLFSGESDAETGDQPEETSEEISPDLENFSTALQKDPDNIDALTNAGNSFYDQSLYDSALYYYNRVLSLDANNSPVLYNKGLVLYNQKNYSESAGLASRCIQIDPSNTDALLLLGDNYQGQNNLDLALASYNKAYESGVRSAALSNMLAYIYDEKKNALKAISFYKETLKLDSARTDVYGRLAVLEPQNKDWYVRKEREWKGK